MDNKSLEHHCGVNKVREDLDKITRKLAMVRDSASYKNNHNNHRKKKASTSPKERESFDHTVRLRAMKELQRREKEFAMEIKQEYKPYLEADVQTIKDFPETIGSPKTKRQLIKMRKEIFNRRLDIELQRKKIEEFRLTDILKEERSRLKYEELKDSKKN
mgnify:FL=1